MSCVCIMLAFFCKWLYHSVMYVFYLYFKYGSERISMWMVLRELYNCG